MENDLEDLSLAMENILPTSGVMKDALDEEECGRGTMSAEDLLLRFFSGSLVFLPSTLGSLPQRDTFCGLDAEDAFIERNLNLPPALLLARWPLFEGNRVFSEKSSSSSSPES